MQEKKERPPILEKFVKRDLPAVARPVPDVVRHRLAITAEEPEGYNPYDKPPPPVTEVELEASLARRRRANPRG